MSVDVRTRAGLVGLVAALAAAGPAVVPLAPGAAAAAAADTCQGQPVTIVVDQNFVEGTDGPDVIVLQGSGSDSASATVFALGGDDLVCVRDGLRYATVHAGEGDDSVTVESTDHGLEWAVGILGPGDDRYVGGPRRDIVTDYDPVGGDDGLGGNYPDSGDDIVSTLGGDDLVLAGGRTGPAQLDGIDLGEGDDVLELGPSGTTPASRLRGGAGNDRVTLFSIPDQPMVMDLPQRRAAVLRSRVIARGWTDFEEHGVRSNLRSGTYDPEQIPASITVRGTAARDRVFLGTMDYTDGESTVVDVDLLGERDELTVDSGARGRVNGGDGRDLIHVNGLDGRPFRLDLAAGRLTLEGLRGGLTVSRFQDAHAISSRSVHGTIVGDADHNRLTGCAVMYGGAGNDTIGPVATPDVECRTGIRAVGGAGKDRLIGTPLDDYLDGGAAYDTANGSDGADTCRAEYRRNCER